MKTPTVWFGAQFPGGHVVDVTSTVLEQTLPGDTITASSLYRMSGLDIDSVVAWRYMNFKTFEEREITEEGFVLEE